MFGATAERRREVWFGLVLLVSVPAVLACLELGFRAYREARNPDRVDWRGLVAEASVTDPATGLPRFLPGSRFGHLSFNSLGMRGPEPRVPAPPDLVRIAFVGDSKVMSANYPEDLTLSAQTVAALALLVPHCRFDYVTIAGPDYDMALLARIWDEVAPSLAPDMAVVLAGSVEQFVRGGPAEAGAPRRSGAGIPAGARRSGAIRSELLLALQRRLAFASAMLTPDRPVALDPQALAEGYRRRAAPLVAAIGPVPVLALGYRSRLRPDQTPALQTRLARNLMLAVPGLGPSGAVELSERNVAQMAALAAEAGWTYADPIAAIPADTAHFLDDVHFTDRGLARLAGDVAAIIAPAVRPDCTLAGDRL